MFQLCSCRMEAKSAFFPLRITLRGETPHFFSPIWRQHGPNKRQLPEKVVKQGGTPILGTFWRVWGFPVKTVCQTGLPEDTSQQRKRYTTLRGSSQRPSRGCISHPCVSRAQIHHRFHRKSPKLTKSAQNRGTSLFDQFFTKVAPL